MSDDGPNLRKELHDVLQAHPPMAGDAEDVTHDAGVITQFVIVTEWATYTDEGPVRTLSVLSGGPDCDGSLAPWTRDGLLSHAISDTFNAS